MNFISLLINETKLYGYELKQYWFETVSGVLLMCGMFTALFYGVKSFAIDANAAGSAQSLDGLLFGFLLWTFAISAYSSVTKIVIENNHKGTLEQLFMCPQGFVRLMFARVTIELIWDMILLAITAVLAMAFTGNWISLNYAYFYLLLFISGPALIGLSFMICGLALVFKKVETIGALINIVLMGIVALDALPFNVFSLLPFAAGASLARDIVLEGQALNLVHLGIVVANSLFYMVIGLSIFKVMEKRAKKLNLLCQY